MCDPMTLISGIGAIFGALSNKPPKPPEPPEPVLPSAPGRAQTTNKEDVNVDLGGERAGDTARKKSLTATAKKGGSSLRTSKASVINII